MTEQDVLQVQDLVLRTPAGEIEQKQSAWRAALAAEYPGANERRQALIAELLAENAVDLRSVLADWRLKCHREHAPGETCVADASLAELAAGNLGLLRQWGRADLAEPAEAEIASIAASNLTKLARMTLRGEANTYWGNDYASHLRRAMRRGACLVTTNPVLVNTARKEEPQYWVQVRDDLRAAHPGFSPAELAYALTIQVVVGNARLLRPIWELSSGRLGYVSLQLSPECATDSEKMISEALWVYDQLAEALGGTPNTVFKVPGTAAGLDVAAELTSRGLGVNITVNFSLPQEIAFAAVIEKHSTAPVSFRTFMDGRLDDPVGDEMKEAGVSDWELVKQWCTTLVRQREYRLISKAPRAGGMGCAKAFPLPAAGRGPWNILRSIHREPEAGMFITIFPNRQEQFDEEPREINPEGMWDQAPEGYRDKLWKSKLFRQAYEPDGMRVEEFETFVPSVRTLTQFCSEYQDFLGWVNG